MVTMLFMVSGSNKIFSPKWRSWEHSQGELEDLAAVLETHDWGL